MERSLVLEGTERSRVEGCQGLRQLSEGGAQESGEDCWADRCASELVPAQVSLRAGLWHWELQVDTLARAGASRKLFLCCCLWERQRRGGRKGSTNVVRRFAGVQVSWQSRRRAVMLGCRRILPSGEGSVLYHHGFGILVRGGGYVGRCHSYIYPALLKRFPSPL